MKTNFDTLLDRRAHAMETARCPYDREELYRLVAAAVGRAEAASRVGVRWHELARYAAAACVAMLIGWGAYCVTPVEEGLTMRSTAAISSGQVNATINNMISHGTEAFQ